MCSASTSNLTGTIPYHTIPCPYPRHPSRPLESNILASVYQSIIHLRTPITLLTIKHRPQGSRDLRNKSTMFTQKHLFRGFLLCWVTCLVASSGSSRISSSRWALSIGARVEQSLLAKRTKPQSPTTTSIATMTSRKRTADYRGGATAAAKTMTARQMETFK
jgi:hypothetical protein